MCVMFKMQTKLKYPTLVVKRLELLTCCIKEFDEIFGGSCRGCVVWCTACLSAKEACLPA